MQGLDKLLRLQFPHQSSSQKLKFTNRFQPLQKYIFNRLLRKKLHCSDNFFVEEKKSTRFGEWTRLKRDYQWKAGRRAMELARSWFRTGQPAPPAEFLQLLQCSPYINNLELITGTPELKPR